MATAAAILRPVTIPALAHVFAAKCVTILDGGCFIADIDTTIGSVRGLVLLHGVDASDLTSPDGRAAANFLAGILGTEVSGQTPLRLKPYAVGPAQVPPTPVGGCWWCDVWTVPDGKNVAQQVIDASHGISLDIPLVAI